MSLRVIPWVLAIAGLLVPLVASGFTFWSILVLWLMALGGFWALGRLMQPGRSQRLIVAVIALPVLFIFAWEGGWWLIPADLAWIMVEIAAPSHEPDPTPTGR